MSSAIAALRPMNIWRMKGSQDFAVSPREAVRVGTGGRGRPAEKLLAFGLHDLFKPLFQAPALSGVARKKNQAAGVLPGTRERNAGFPAGLQQKGMGHLQQHPRTVAGVGFAAAG